MSAKPKPSATDIKITAPLLPATKSKRARQTKP
jgi:hypothetical protein